MAFKDDIRTMKAVSPDLNETGSIVGILYNHILGSKVLEQRLTLAALLQKLEIPIR